MFLNNFYKLISSVWESCQYGQNKVDIVDTSGVTRNISGITYVDSSDRISMLAPFMFNISQTSRTGSLLTISNNTTQYYNNTSTGSDADCNGVIIGDGDDPVTPADYALSGNQIVTFTATSSLAVTHNDTTGKTFAVATYNITNTGTDPFTIREIGASFASNVQNPTVYFRVLYERTVLETPITIEPGSTGVLIYRVELS